MAERIKNAALICDEFGDNADFGKVFAQWKAPEDLGEWDTAELIERRAQSLEASTLAIFAGVYQAMAPLSGAEQKLVARLVCHGRSVTEILKILGDARGECMAQVRFDEPVPDHYDGWWGGSTAMRLGPHLSTYMLILGMVLAEYGWQLAALGRPPLLPALDRKAISVATAQSIGIMSGGPKPGMAPSPSPSPSPSRYAGLPDPSPYRQGKF